MPTTPGPSNVSTGPSDVVCFEAVWNPITNSGVVNGAGVRHGIMTDHETHHEANPEEDDERRSGDRRSNVDRRKHDSGAPDGVEKRKGERRKGDRRARP